MLSDQIRCSFPHLVYVQWKGYKCRCPTFHGIRHRRIANVILICLCNHILIAWMPVIRHLFRSNNYNILRHSPVQSISKPLSGNRTFCVKYRHIAKSMVPILVPLFVSAFRRANDLAMAMEARCYRGGDGRTKMKPLHYTGVDRTAYVLVIFYVAAVVIIGRCVPFHVWIF